MRRVGLIPAVVALFVAGAAYGQVWSEYENRQEFFAVNFPGDPVRTMSTFKTSKGTTLPAVVFTAEAPASSITAGKYTVTVVNYASAPGEIATAPDPRPGTCPESGLDSHIDSGVRRHSSQRNPRGAHGGHSVHRW